MTDESIYSNLCCYDSRNPDSSVDGTVEKPGDICYCDNCFYGRDTLALEIIRLKELITEPYCQTKENDEKTM